MLGGARFPCALTLAFVGDDDIRELNDKFRSVRHATDVLSFPSMVLDPQNGIPLLGDVVISVPTAKAQAERNDRGLSQELELLVVHGVLHLLGFDHNTPLRKARMWRIQNKATRRVHVRQDKSKAPHHG